MDKCERCNQGEEHVYCCHNCEKFAAEIAVLSIEKRDIKAAYDEQVKTGLELESQRDAALLQLHEERLNHKGTAELLCLEKVKSNDALRLISEKRQMIVDELLEAKMIHNVDKGCGISDVLQRLLDKWPTEKRNHECPCKKCGLWCIRHCAEDSIHCTC